MTNDEAKAICRHLLLAKQSLGLSPEKTSGHSSKIGSIRDRLNPDSLTYDGDVDTAHHELQLVYAELEKLKAVQPVSALPGEEIARRNPPTLLAGVAEALRQLDDAGARLVPLLKSRDGHAST